MLSAKNIVQQTVIFSLVISFLSSASIDPLSKISIKSNRATCSKTKSAGSDVILKYLDNVHVEFADHSTVTSRELEIVCNLKKTAAKKKDSEKYTSQFNQNSGRIDKALSHFKKITFTGNVVITKDEFKATADAADVTIEQRVCVLKGNVHIQHTKKASQNFPVDVKSEAATIKLDSQQVLLAGSSKNPVSTVINLENHPIICNKKSKKNQQQHKKEAVKKA